MGVKKSLEELIMLMHQFNIDTQIIQKFLLELGFSAERVNQEIAKIALIQDIPPEKKQPPQKEGLILSKINSLENRLLIITQKLDYLTKKLDEPK